MIACLVLPDEFVDKLAARVCFGEGMGKLLAEVRGKVLLKNRSDASLINSFDVEEDFSTVMLRVSQ